ncbi:MAG TPA: lysophospholipid acyltransferase family protein [Euzebyales bacterium]
MPTTALHLVHRVAAPPVAWLLRPTVTGTVNVPAHGGVLLAVNHVSNLDNYLVSAVCPRPVAYVGKQELARGLFGAFNVAMGMVPIERGRADASVIEQVADVVRRGEVVALFPEGSRSPTGQLFRFRSGLARIAHAARADVVPVGIRGAADVWPRGRWPKPRRPAPGLLEVHFGAPVAPPEVPQGRARRVWTEQIRAQVARLSGQTMADSFAPVADDGER